MFCIKCGAQLNGAAFCTSCGTQANAAATPPIAQPAPSSYQAPYVAPATPTTNGLAVASFVISLVCLPILGFILGLVALNQINNSPTPQGGKGLAQAGVIIGAVFTFIWVLLLLNPAFWVGFNSAYYGY